ncbi:glutathione S-transferase N-terminal domain-containing protein [Vibrio lamellibrachiae]|uniref:glutathione S-transferase N-terminal domain-containing protein n=1 Tax=Vibrio lamellibrachiae TaxID=2910253 RepID=UPI003D13D860
MELVVGRDSTWSLRAWLCAQIAKVDLTLIVIDLTLPDYKHELYRHTASGLVPALKLDDCVIHDSLAIAEYFNEIGATGLYPVDSVQRAQARSLISELHSGFFQLRQQCPFSLDPVEPLIEISDELQLEIQRVEMIFSKATLPFMYREAGAVDAFYAILAFRLQSYGIVFEDHAGKYQESLLNWPLLQESIELAMQWRRA